MKTIRIIAKRITLPNANNTISVNDIDIEDIVKEYSAEYIIDLEKYLLTQIKNDIYLVLILQKKSN